MASHPMDGRRHLGETSDDIYGRMLWNILLSMEYLSIHGWKISVGGMQPVLLCKSTQSRACALIDKACLARNNQNHLI